MNHLFNKIIIIGLGLIGGSIAAAVTDRGLSKEVLVYNRSENAINFAIENNIIDKKFNFDQNLDENDLIIVATPLFAYEDIFQKIQKNNYKSLIIDIGSVKLYPEELYQQIFGQNNLFIPCHPIAGKESSGIENADKNLFSDKKLIITKFCQNDQNIVKIQDLWQKIGSKIVILDAKTHDKIFCLISHLPQIISFLYQDKRPDNLPQILQRHLRIENSNKNIWREIFQLNKKNIDKYLNVFRKNYLILKNENNYQLKIIINQIQKKFDFKSINIDLDHELINKRVRLVTAFLQIPEIIEFQDFAGSGFKDFTAILGNY